MERILITAVFLVILSRAGIDGQGNA
ncbi:MAG: hypothetical protein H6Q23_1826, partial [Bacteroidetes bacterium]|nr:hypothetical protein [Bacteroidota bacterium]